MVSIQFLGINAQFAINLLAAFVAFAVCWLRFDAWTARRSHAELLSWLGFALLTAGFMLAGSAVTGGSSWSEGLNGAAIGAKALGLLAIVLAQLFEPLQAVPDISGDSDRLALTSRKRSTKKHHGVLAFSWPAGLNAVGALVGVAVLAGIVAGLYWRRATSGLERHLKPVAYGFLAWSLAELALAATHLPTVANPHLETALAAFGPVWWLSLLLSLAGSLVLGRWVWSYLTKRLLSQLYMALIAQVIVIFLLATMSFTYLMLRDVKSAQLNDLQTASRVLQYAVVSRQAQNEAEAQTAAATASVASAVATRNQVGLAAALTSFYRDHHVSSLIVTDASGGVLWRAEDPERYGDSVSSDPLVRRALTGQTASSVVVSSGVTAPIVALTAVSPITGTDGLVVGSVTLGVDVTSGFVDGIEASTGLSSTVYGGQVRAATTLTDAAGSRQIGVSLTDATAVSQVLQHNQTYTGSVTINNRPYLTAITPLVDVNNQPVGMLQAARPATDLFAAADHSLQLMLLLASALVLLAALPLFKLAKYIERQLQ